MPKNLQYNNENKLCHLLGIRQLTLETLQSILSQAQSFLDKHDNIVWQPLLKNKTVVNLFFENSTRTRMSFEIAAQHLSANVINFDAMSSSLSKGETLLDTIQNIEAMGVDILVIRHKDDNTVEFIAEHLSTNTHIANAGTGCYEHPTQALLDVFTMLRHKPDLVNQTVTIVGDILHSRVANSTISALKLLGVKNIRVAGPKEFLPESLNDAGVSVHHQLDSAIKDADVVMTLRIQKERMQNKMISDDDYHKAFGITPEKMRLAKHDAILMHPGPINRGVELVDSVADGAQSVILQQVKFGVAIRMAVMAVIINNKVM